MLGIDVVDVERLRAALERTPALEARLFTKKERVYCRAGRRPEVRFAGTLAAKEAVIKALRLGSLVAWAGCIEIERAETGVPSAFVIDSSSKRVVEVSISHDGPVAVAVALADAVQPAEGRSALTV
jgi:holo-[acyl-carrier protein] synthase